MAKESGEAVVPIDQDFYEDLVSLYDEIAVNLEISREPKEEEGKKFASEGLVLLDKFHPSMDVTEFCKVFKKVEALLDKHHSEKNDEKLELYLGDQKALNKRLYKLMQGSPIEDVFDLSQCEYKARFGAILAYTIKPFLKAYGNYIGDKYPAGFWKKGYCPVCGHGAAMATLSKDEEGKRYLWCPVCEHQWTFKRIGCPSCLEDNPDKLGYFRVEDRDDGYRVNVCYTCKRYIKTYDEKKRINKDRDHFLEEKKTAELDYLAIKEGFKPIE